MLVLWRQRRGRAFCLALALRVIRRLSTISIFPLTVFGVLANFCLIDFKGVDNMLDQLEHPMQAQDDSETLSENVFRRIQAAIVKGEIAPGSKISEPELARTYGISRGPLREAIPPGRSAPAGAGAPCRRPGGVPEPCRADRTLRNP